MYLPVPPQPDCATAWLAAAKLVDEQPGHAAHNVIIDVSNPIAGADVGDPIADRVDAFLRARGKSIETIANTIFPQSIYRRHGAPKFFDVFNDQILPKIRNTDRWSGYYFERMTRGPTPTGRVVNQLWEIVGRILDEGNNSLNKFELSLFDPDRDIDNSPYGGQCLSFLSFKLISGAPRKLLLTAQYRNHYYTEKLLGNLIGLGRLMNFVAQETKTATGSLTVISTHAEIDQVGGKRADVVNLLRECEVARMAKQPAA